MRWTVSLVALLVALAGCSDNNPPETEPPAGGDPGDPGDPMDPVDPRPEPQPITQIKLLTQYDLTDCTGVTFGTSADAGAVDALLPEGYRAARGVGDRAQVVADVFQCGTFTAAGSVFEDVWFGRAFTPIEPPSAYANLSVDAHHYVLQMIGGDDILAALWLAAGYPTHSGNTSDDSVPPSLSWSAGDYQWTSPVAAAPTGASELSFAWFHEMETGNVIVWTGNETFSAGSAGAGRLAVPSGSPLASLELAGGAGLAGTVAAVSGVEYTGNNLVLDLAEPR